MTATRFEGSFLGDSSRIRADTILECKICWYSYNPAAGDEARQIPPGTAFSALPGDWRCPQCDNERDQFMVIDAGPRAPAHDPRLMQTREEKPRQLVESFRQIFNTKMRDTPFSNNSLSVEAIGFRIWENRIVGILLTPWCMNLVILPSPDEDWSGIRIGVKRSFMFPSGEYEFIYNNRPPAGSYFACSLFSSMGEFASQLQASDVARAAMTGLFDDANRDDTDRTADISAMREAELARADGQNAPDAAPASSDATSSGLPFNPSRRAIISAGLAPASDDATLT